MKQTCLSAGIGGGLDGRRFLSEFLFGVTGVLRATTGGGDDSNEGSFLLDSGRGVPSGWAPVSLGADEGAGDDVDGRPGLDGRWGGVLIESTSRSMSGLVRPDSTGLTSTRSAAGRSDATADVRAV